MSEQVDKADVFPVLRRFAKALGVAALCASLLSLCAEWLWIGSLFNHLSAHAVLCLLFCIPIVAKDRLPSLMVIAAILIFSLPWLYQAYEQRAPRLTVNQGNAISFLVANTAWWNRQESDLVAQELINTDASFCALIEANPALSRSVRATKYWPHARGSTRLGPYSILVLSQWEIIEDKMHVIQGKQRDLNLAEGEQKEPLADSDLIIFDLLIDFNKTPIRVLVAHPPSPLFPALLSDRSKVLGKVAQLIKDSKEPCVLLGDLNAVPASYEWRHLHEIGLQRPQGRQMRTWMWPGLDWLRQGFGLAIDYIASTQEFQMSPLQYYRITGSDHLAIRSTLALIESNHSE